MIISSGNRLLICHRRLFNDDHSRYFIGVAEAYESGMVKMSGYTWLRDHINGTFQTRQDLRTKIMSLSSGTLICYLLPDEFDPNDALFEQLGNHIWLVDKSSQFKMELTEGVYPKSITSSKPSR